MTSLEATKRIAPKRNKGRFKLIAMLVFIVIMIVLIMMNSKQVKESEVKAEADRSVAAVEYKVVDSATSSKVKARCEAQLSTIAGNSRNGITVDDVAYIGDVERVDLFRGQVVYEVEHMAFYSDGSVTRTKTCRVDDDFDRAEIRP